MTADPDIDLVLRVIVDDDRHAFGELVKRHQSPVRNLLRRLTRGDAARADDLAQDTFISSTNWTERIGPVAALATLRKHSALDAGAHLMDMGKMVQEGWKRLGENSGIPLTVGGIPPLAHFVFNTDDPLATKALFVQLMLAQGFLASTLFYAMYAHTEAHVASYLDAVRAAFDEIATAVHQGDLHSRLKGQPASSGFKRLT